MRRSSVPARTEAQAAAAPPGPGGAALAGDWKGSGPTTCLIRYSRVANISRLVADTLGLELTVCQKTAVRTIEPLRPTTSTSVCGSLVWRGSHRRAGSGGSDRSRRPSPCWPAQVAARATPSLYRGGRHRRSSRDGCGRSGRADAHRLAAPWESDPQREKPIQPWHSQPQPAWQGSPLVGQCSGAGSQNPQTPVPRFRVIECALGAQAGWAHDESDRFWSSAGMLCLC